MVQVTTLFWDVGGVLLTNGWDRVSRAQAVERFNLDGQDFEARHKLMDAELETGDLTLDEYLRQTVFYRARPFTQAEFKAFMLAQSHPYPEALAVLDRVASSGNYLLATLNNESLELNLYRIDRFDLRRYFTVFLSSCYLGVRKPDEAIYRKALWITQRPPEESVLIDDREANLEPAERCGMRTIRYQTPPQAQHDLERLGVQF